MKNVLMALTIILALVPALSMASVRVFNSSGTNLGTYTDIKCSTGINCAQVSGKAQFTLGTVDMVGDGANQLYGFLQNRISTSGTRTLTFAECGSTVSNDASVVYTLPSISGDATENGCRFSFIVGNGVAVTTYLHVKPTAGEQILLLTNKVGDIISADANGESVTLESSNGGVWAPVGGAQGTWSDEN